MPGAGLTDYGERAGQGGEILRTHRVTVHGRGIEGWLREPRRHIIGQDAAMGVIEPDGFAFQGREIGRDLRDRFAAIPKDRSHLHRRASEYYPVVVVGCLDADAVIPGSEEVPLERAAHRPSPISSSSCLASVGSPGRCASSRSAHFRQ